MARYYAWCDTWSHSATQSPQFTYVPPWSVPMLISKIMTRECADSESVLLLKQSALFHFQSLLLVILLLICTSTYVRSIAPRLIDRNKQGYVRVGLCALCYTTCIGHIWSYVLLRCRFLGIFFMCARIGSSTWSIDLILTFICYSFALCGFYTLTGERLSPYVALSCIVMAVTILVQ